MQATLIKNALANNEKKIEIIILIFKDDMIFEQFIHSFIFYFHERIQVARLLKVYLEQA